MIFIYNGIFTICIFYWIEFYVKYLKSIVYAICTNGIQDPYIYLFF